MRASWLLEGGVRMQGGLCGSMYHSWTFPLGFILDKSAGLSQA